MMTSTATASAPFPCTLRPATAADAAAIATLVNSAYRGDSSRQGWTTEADLLAGPRILATEVLDLVAAADALILLCVRGSELIACVQLKKDGSSAYLGMFVVRPGLQGQGLGKYFMHAAEQHARQLWQAETVWMTVISIRPELIAYYQRRGYVRTGRTLPFPQNAKESMLVEHLEFDVLEKSLTPEHQ